METALATHSAPTALIPTNIPEAVSFSEQMALANLIPEHLQKKPADCLRVVMQSSQWGMNPFAVADSTSIIHGKLMFEGKLVAAVVNSRGNLSKRLNYKFTGEGNNLKLVVTGRVRGEEEDREITLTYQQACEINKNGQVRKNPEQQMSYIGARIWARRHMPELMLGVHADDEFSADEPETGDGEQGERPKAPAKSGKRNKSKTKTKDTPKAEEVDDAIDVTEVTDERPAQPEKPEAEAPAQASEAKTEKADAKEAPKAAETSEDADVVDVEEELVDDEQKPALEVDLKNPRTTLKKDERLESVLVRFVEVVQSKTKAPANKPILKIQVEGPYTGDAYSYDTENPLFQVERPVIVTFKGVGAPGNRVVAFVDSIQAGK
ncbi:hypothetical protein [Cerasicoccus frondis]|uniref:hypothetical protein n=1 Tax=Cerasicoccus frondis TaxID=490090 RepID=UPI00285249F8|nr:hypothetical protein [Cerasicoccus frondis]